MPAKEVAPKSQSVGRMKIQLKKFFASLGGASSDFESPFKIKLTACLRRCLERQRSTKRPTRHNISPKNIQNDCCQGALYYKHRHTSSMLVEAQLDGTGEDRGKRGIPCAICR